MKVIINEAEQLQIRAFNEEVTNSLRQRESNIYNHTINATPFLRINCLQEVTYKESASTENRKENNLKEKSRQLFPDGADKNIDGFTLTFDSNVDAMYNSTEQVIGKNIGFRGKFFDVKIKNPRRVPPPTLNQMVAKCGESAGYYTTAQLSFTVNSLEQLEFLVPFLLNPANAVFLEWGINSPNIKNIDMFGPYDVQLLRNSIEVDTELDTGTQERFYQRFNRVVRESRGDYEFMFGIINNFDFTLNENLGYNITVDVISAELSRMTSPANFGIDNNSSGNSLLNTNGSSSSGGGGAAFVFDEMPLDFYLKKFYDILSIEYDNKKDTDIPTDLLPFKNSTKNSYVTLGAICRFLDGDLKRLVDLYQTFKTLGMGQYVDEREDYIKKLPPKSERFIADNIKINFGREVPIVSFSDDVIIFRDDMFTGVLTESAISPGVQELRSSLGRERPYLFYNISDKHIIEYDLEGGDRFEQIVQGAGGTVVSDPTDRFIINRTERQLRYQSSFSIKKRFIKPKMLSHGSSDDFEYLKNIYINWDTFSQIYRQANGKPIDVLSKLLSIINNAVGGILNITSIESVDEITGKSRVSLVDIGNTKLDTSETYTFKINSKNSILNGVGYSLGLEGILGDYVYAQSLDLTSGEGESQKLNLSIFTKHENGLEIRDMRLDKLKSVIKKRRSSNNDSITSNTSIASVPSSIQNQEEYQEWNYKRYDDYVKTKYNGLLFVRKTQPPRPTESTDNINFNNKVISELETMIASGGSYNIENAAYEINKRYNIRRIPIMFSHSKNAVTQYHAFKSLDIKGEDSEETTTDVENKRQLGGVHPLLESKLDFTILGIGGINPLQYFKVDGIPDAYSKRGQFCVMDVQHTVTREAWYTSLSSRFRPTYEDEK